MRPIPHKLRKKMAASPFYQKCCITGLRGKIEWHHNLIYAGRQVNEEWCILPLLEEIHEKIAEYKEQCDWIMLNRASDEDLARYSKSVDYKAKRDRLNKIYGIYTA